MVKLFAIKRLLFICTIALLPTFLLSMNAHAKKVYGLYEKVQLLELNHATLKAKLDTGAQTASLSAKDIVLFEKNGEPWVRFQPQAKGMDFAVMEKKLVRHSRIKIRVGDVQEDDEDELDTTSARRPVVLMDICFDGKVYAIEVNLTDRSRFRYPLLLGSSSLIKFKAIVDPSLKYQAADTCQAVETK